MVSTPQIVLPADFEWIVEDGKLGLKWLKLSGANPIVVDFLSGAGKYRLKTAAFKKQLFARAIGFKSPPWRVFDATVGFGQDTANLAVLGCEVSGAEISPIVFALVSDGLQRAQLNVQLLHADAREVLAAMSADQRPDVVYMDPMFPEIGKSALSSKEMRVLQALVSADSNADKELFDVAMSVARSRVVVKRPRQAPPLAEGVHHRYVGRSIRYDYYVPKPNVIF